MFLISLFPPTAPHHSSSAGAIQSVVQGLVTSAFPGSWLEMKHMGPVPDTRYQSHQTRGLDLNKLAGDFPGGPVAKTL